MVAVLGARAARELGRVRGYLGHEPERDGLVERGRLGGGAAAHRHLDGLPGPGPVRARGAAVAPRAVAGPEQRRVERSRRLGRERHLARAVRAHAHLVVCALERHVHGVARARLLHVGEDGGLRLRLVQRRCENPAAVVLNRRGDHPFSQVGSSRLPRGARPGEARAVGDGGVNGIAGRLGLVAVDAQGRVFRARHEGAPAVRARKVGPVELAGERRAVDHGAVVPLRDARRPRVHGQTEVHARAADGRVYVGGQLLQRARVVVGPHLDGPSAEERRESRTQPALLAPHRERLLHQLLGGQHGSERGCVGRPQLLGRPRLLHGALFGQGLVLGLGRRVGDPRCGVVAREDGGGARREARGVGLLHQRAHLLGILAGHVHLPDAHAGVGLSPVQPKVNRAACHECRCQHRHGQRHAAATHQRAEGARGPACPAPGEREHGQQRPPRETERAADGASCRRLARGALRPERGGVVRGGSLPARRGCAALAGRRGMGCAGRGPSRLGRCGRRSAPGSGGRALCGAGRGTPARPRGRLRIRALAPRRAARARRPSRHRLPSLRLGGCGFALGGAHLRECGKGVVDRGEEREHEPRVHEPDAPRVRARREARQPGGVHHAEAV